MGQMQIAIVGECMVELQQQSQELLSRKFGGDTLNTAVYLSRLTRSADINVSYISGLGEDMFSQQMLHSWQQEGIDTQYVQHLTNKLPGLYLIETDPDGERHFRYWRNDSAAKYCLEQDNYPEIAKALTQFNWIYLSGISLAILTSKSRDNLFTALEQAKAAGCKIIFDNNYRPALWENLEETQQIYQQILQLTDLALLTFDDELALYGEHTTNDCLSRTRQLGVNSIVLKMGSQPCHIFVENEHYTVAANKVPKENVVDTTAAGDSFGAGFIAAMLLGKDPQTCAHWGHDLAGTVIRYKGAIIDRNNMPLLT
ncbi:2-dehydro-3-deoxygluconokinase [Celerinatantimonas diazotrophica]|uniref:2-dehydro-3-deoxygluconokinase n=1 Tax=Celerinatantimonas diazotrophica TaxID=412034 RepID=A0A4R1J7J7_9GAMM|nr:sugar kinase [Celerinatantimonas diazotrophica]TCK46499.1 2-dehydro-3-deoxygluconokinase [Celerinatantimonas diazotrophica]CAG9296549.1 2-dehydro-3-deoxygluconokinase [Celerinatantimonas diazotrophica]